MDERKWYLRTQEETFGPETRATLVDWARLGRIQPGQEVSDDNVIWTKVEDVPFLDMRFSIDIGDGNPRGPFNQTAADALIASGRLPAGARMLETRAPFPPEEEPTAEAEPPAESEPTAEAEPLAEESKAEEISKAEVVEQPELFAESSAAGRDGAPSPSVVEKIVEVPVEKIVEKIVEVPVEKIVEKIVEVPVEKIVTVVDDTRVKELEEQLSEERARFATLQEKSDETSKLASGQRTEIARLEAEIANATEREKSLNERLVEQERSFRERLSEQEKTAGERLAESEAKFEKAVRDATDREAKLSEQVVALEDELRRLPQAASEIADIQAAMYGLMTKESEEIESLLAAEKAEAEEFRRRCEARCDRLRERRRELLKRSGANVEQMTRKALVERPEDPRTAQLRRELDELRRADEKRLLDAAARIRELEASVREREDERRRTDAGLKDLTELRRENAALREQLSARERDLLQERERSEQLRQREEVSRQAMVARLQQLESPAIGIQVSNSANQSREAKRVKIPGWMRIGVGK